MTVIVLLTESACELYQGSCVMEVIGPFESHEAAYAEVEAHRERYPAWTRPHFMVLNDPNRR